MSKENESDFGAYFKDSIVHLSSIQLSDVKNVSEFKETVSQKAKDIHKKRNSPSKDINFLKIARPVEIKSTTSEKNAPNQPTFNHILNFECTRNGALKNHSKQNVNSGNVFKEKLAEEERSPSNRNLYNPNIVLSYTNDIQHCEKRSDNNTNIVTRLVNNSANTIRGPSTLSSTDSKLTSSIMSSDVLSIVPTEDKCKLASWGLPINILEKYQSKGVTNMFPWQVECLLCERVISSNRNLVYSAPTSAGKTLVAEILLLKTVLERQKKTIFVLPFVSVVREKMYYFKDLLENSGIKVHGFMGGIAPAGGFTATHIAIATIEKANSLINHLMEEGDLDSLGSVIIDELHLIGDPNRGYLLELLLTKLKYMNLREHNVNIQLIGMSATLPNLCLLAEWLDAAFYKTEFRPVPLNEQCKMGNHIYDANLHLIRTLTPSSELPVDEDNIFQLCIETITDGHSVLIFCPTKNWCEKLAGQISSTFYKLGRENSSLGEILKQQLDSTMILETLEQLKRSPTGLDDVLRRTISFGVAFHHAGLTMEERDIIEGSFKSGAIRVLTATSTLSSGVNLPARRVIIRTPIFGGHFLDTLTYKQMIGRAGRMGQDTAGESILICKPAQQNAAKSLLSAKLKPIQSCLKSSEPFIRALLEAIASNVVITSADLELYAASTLVSFSEKNSMKDPCSLAVKFLIDNEFVKSQDTGKESRWMASHLGKACLAASIHPKEGLFLFEELQRARKCLALDTELHIVYLVTPVNTGSQLGTIDWIVFMELWKTMSEGERRVGDLVGVNERFLMSAVKGLVKSGKSLNIHRRFYTAMALHDLVREVSLDDVCKQYGCCRGMLQSLQQSAATFAGMVTQFCKQLGWDCLELLIAQFQTRLQFGVRRELLDLLRLPLMDGIRARSLYKQGITCVADLAIANELHVEQALYKALPFESEKDCNDPNGLIVDNKGKMRSVFISGKDGVTPHEAAIMLIDEARIFLQAELKLQNVAWEQKDNSVSRNVSNKSIGCNKSVEISAVDISSNVRLNISKTITHANKSNTSKCREPRYLSKLYCNESILTNTETQTRLENSFVPRVAQCTMMKKVTEAVKNAESKDVLLHQKNSVLYPQSMGIGQALQQNALHCTNQECKNIYLAKDIQTSNHPMNVFETTKKKLSTSVEEKYDTISSTIFKNSVDKVVVNENIEVECPKNGEKSNSNILSSEIFNDDFAVSKSVIDNSVKLPLSSMIEDPKPASPNLFEESFGLDTQVCNALEENIIDSLHTSEMEGEVITEAERLIKSVTSRKFNEPKKHNSPNSLSVKCDVETTSKTCLSWNDDSWNQSGGILKKIGRLEKDKLNMNILLQSPIRQSGNVETITASKSVHAQKTKTQSEITKTKKENVGQASLKRKLRKVPADGSPVASIIIYNNGRKPSVDSNKSDSDDVVISTQIVNSPLLPVTRTLHSKEETQSSNIISSNSSKLRSHMKKPVLKDILPRYAALTVSTNTLSNFEDVPVKKAKISQTPAVESVENKVIIPEKRSTPCQNKIHIDCDEPKNTVKVSTTWNGVNIIRLANDKRTFSAFKRDAVKKSRIALALSCEAYVNDDAINVIGTKVIRSKCKQRKRKVRKSTDAFIFENRRIVGAMISWESNVAYYLSFNTTEESKVPAIEQLGILKTLLSQTSLYVTCFAVKDIYKMLYQCCKIYPNCRFLDPKTAHWLLSGDGIDKNFNEMVSLYIPQGIVIMKQIEIRSNTNGPGLYINSSLPGETRAAIEVALIWDIQNILSIKLKEQNLSLKQVFEEIEMRTIPILARMELNGLGMCPKSLQELISTIETEMSILEERAYGLAGRKFHISSPKDVAEILGLNRGKRLCTNKAVLEQCENPISELVMLWRKLNVTQTKILYPLLSSIQNKSRVHGNCVTCTQTGRISMYEPNLQNIPKDFNSVSDGLVISVRKAFVPATNNIMLSADYCQLELRILAHFSKDAMLCDAIQKEGDVFKAIAAKWNGVIEDQVNDIMRQRTKQLCYGMIYGMGTKTLAESLSVTESEAKEFLETFMNTYPGIREWLKNELMEARKHGYVTTLMGRRRMFPGLLSTNSAEKSQCERQAINTKVQGSAADIAKKAMIIIDDRMHKEFPDAPTIIFSTNDVRKTTRSSKDTHLRGGYLVLQLHDELLYEVHLPDLDRVAIIVKESMEQACDISVPLPVKIKVGPSWGNLSEWSLGNFNC